MELERINRLVVTFIAVALLFLGSLYYFVSIAFKNKDAIENSRNIVEVEDFLYTLE